MPELINPIEDIQTELEQLRLYEKHLQQRHLVLLRLALSQQNPETSFEEKQLAFTKEIGNFLAVERTSIWILDRDNTALRCLNLYIRSQDRHFVGDELPAKQFPRYFKFLTEQGVVSADHARTDIQTEEFGQNYLVSNDISSMLDTPLRVGDRLRGVLCCEHVGSPRHWTEDDQQFVMSLADLAALTLAAHDVRRTEETLRALLDSAAQGVVTVDDQGRITLVNSLIERMFRYQRRELLGYPIANFLPKDLCELITAPILEPRPSSRTLSPEIGEYFMARRKDGTEFPLEVGLSYVHHHGQHLALALMTDVSQRVQIEQQLRKSEELYRSVVEDQVDLIARYTPEGIRIFANDAYCRFMGSPRESLIGRPIWEHVPADDRERLRQNFATLTPSSPVHSYEHRDVSPSGKAVINQWVDRGIFDTNGKLRELQSIGRDVTQQRETEARLREAQRLEAIAMLASGIAHDFNNLLTPILIYGENLQKRLPEGSLEANQAQQICCAAERARKLVRRILTFGRKGDHQTRSYQPFAPLMSDTLELVRISLPSNVRMVAEIDDDCGVVEVNSTEVFQVISNLCSNACHALPQGGLLAITAKQVFLEGHDLHLGNGLQPGNYVEINVEDNGVGIPADILSHIFEPFFSTKPACEGTGLGLSVVHGTVTHLGGAIDVTSRVGKGTRFQVYLPCVSSLPAATKESSSEAFGPEQVAKILLVDDDELARKSMQLILEQLGHHVTTCCSGAEALAALKAPAACFDLLLSDLTMPVMSGLELTREVRTFDQGLPILLVTGDSGQADNEAAMRYSVSGFIEKPATASELTTAIQRAIASRST